MHVRFGIIGCGYIAKRHARHIIENNKAFLSAAYDIDRSVTQSFCKTFQIDSTYSLSEFLNRKDIDIVVICTPNGVHADLAIEALNARKHVLVEKPMALSVEDSQRMIAAAEENGKELFVVKQNRFNPPVQELKNLVDTQQLGKLHFVSLNCFWNRNSDYYTRSNWKGTRELDGGTLFTQFSHFVDIMYYLFGEVEDIKGITMNTSHKGLTDFEDTGSFSFRFKNGALGNLAFTTSAYEQNMEGSITVFAENGTVKIGGRYLNTIDYQRSKRFELDSVAMSNPANNYGYYEGSMSNHDKVIHNVVETLNSRETIMTSAYEGMKVVEIIEKMYTSVNAELFSY